jgi:ATP-dependent helicase YprA (DUF1998 family)
VGEESRPIAALDPLGTSSTIEAEYRRYLHSTFAPRRAWVRAEFDRALRNDFDLAKGPFLQAAPPFVAGVSLRDLMDEGLLSPELAALPDPALPIDRPLYAHQETAIRKAVGQGRNLVISTGTGSGKTECFFVPILEHLVRERVTGTIGRPGVRAMLLYPMNALANDQAKRLRRLLTPFPEFTFGRYVGDTPTRAAEAEDLFRARYPGEPRLANELISRDRMQEAPPHILLTNFAMLEYLLLRPSDSSLFDGQTGDSWRFLILDEAHVYDGAKGTEIAMLLRRVRDRVVQSQPGRLQCYATSATLGRGEQDNPALARFATDLFAESFEWLTGDESRQDIVSASLRDLGTGVPSRYRIAASSYQHLLTALRDSQCHVTDLQAELEESVGPLPPAASKETLLTEALQGDETVQSIQRLLESGGKDVRHLAAEALPGRATEDLITLVELCSLAKHDGEDAPVIPARYHFFLRALEGAFVCLHAGHPPDTPRLRLTRHRQCPSCAARGLTAAVFELGVCRFCGAEYLLGEISRGEGLDVFSSAGAAWTRYDRLLWGEATSDDDEDESAGVSDVLDKTEREYLCPGCGQLSAEEATSCVCTDQPERIPVASIVLPADVEVQRRCLRCAGRANSEIVYRFITGTDAPASVIATDLYQALPASSDPDQARLVGEGRKLLTFADSRQDAAFFAPYLERTYRRAVQRRLIADAILDFQGDPPRTGDLELPVRRTAEATLVLDPDDGAQSNSAEVRGWLLREILSVDRRQSLSGTGMAEIRVALPAAYEPPPALLNLGLNEAQVTALLLALLDSIRVQAAVDLPLGVDILDPIFAPRNVVTVLRDRGSEPGVLSWLPGRGHNRRVEYLRKVLDRVGAHADPMTILSDIWTRLLTREDGPWGRTLVASSHPRRGVTWHLSHERFEFISISMDHLPSRCDTCRQLWWNNVLGACPTFSCSGSLVPINVPADLLEDHYARLYRNLLPIGMSVQEHTAHWTSSEASRIQEQFVKGAINVLSCSTTFELGVDIGEIQSVLLRNMPPTPANYVQRSGRAGRRTGSPALVVTFAQRRSHDLSFFDDPMPMIDGTIAPPRITLDNVPITRRHIHSVAIAAFERATGEHRTVEDFFVSPAGDGADTRFLGWLRRRPQELGEALTRICPAPVQGELALEEWGWVEALAETSDEDPTYGWLRRAGADVRDDLAKVQDRIDALAGERKFGQAAAFERLRTTLASRHLLSFLASRNVLPKYGFPVDVVELDVRTPGDYEATRVELTRDLKLAISEYAPGARIVAGKSLWESTGLRVLPNQRLPKYRWAICDECGAFRRGLEELPPCGVCGSERKRAGHAGTYIQPLFGFVGHRSLEKPGDARPRRASLTDTYFGQYQDETPPQLELVESLSRIHEVEVRTSRQGLITIVNRGPHGRPFRICQDCGYAEISGSRSRPKKAPETHADPKRTDRVCRGTLVAVHLGHEYLTDVVEIRMHADFPSAPTGISTLFALLEAAPSIDIDRDEIDGTLYHHSLHEPPAIVLFDSVPGGAGHARRLAEPEELLRLFQAAHERVANCACGEETSCYACLRSYGNQQVHDQLARGSARDLLGSIISVT